VRIISKKKLRDFWQIHASAAKALAGWHQRIRQARWQNYQELNTDIRSADLVGDCVVFNILHNDYRLIARVRFQSQIVYVLKIMTHEEYSRVDWKSECGCFTPPPQPPAKRKTAPRKRRIRGTSNAANNRTRRAR
jgi:mRNA interferase HigB